MRYSSTVVVLLSLILSMADEAMAGLRVPIHQAMPVPTLSPSAYPLAVPTNNLVSFDLAGEDSVDTSSTRRNATREWSTIQSRNVTYQEVNAYSETIFRQGDKDDFDIITTKHEGSVYSTVSSSSLPRDKTNPSGTPSQAAAGLGLPHTLSRPFSLHSTSFDWSRLAGRCYNSTDSRRVLSSSSPSFSSSPSARSDDGVFYYTFHYQTCFSSHSVGQTKHIVPLLLHSTTTEQSNGIEKFSVIENAHVDQTQLNQVGSAYFTRSETIQPSFLTTAGPISRVEPSKQALKQGEGGVFSLAEGSVCQQNGHEIRDTFQLNERHNQEEDDDDDEEGKKNILHQEYVAHRIGGEQRNGANGVNEREIRLNHGTLRLSCAKSLSHHNLSHAWHSRKPTQAHATAAARDNAINSNNNNRNTLQYGVTEETESCIYETTLVHADFCNSMM